MISIRTTFVNECLQQINVQLQQLLYQDNARYYLAGYPNFLIGEKCTLNYEIIRHSMTACTIDVRLQHQMCDIVRFLS